MAGHLPGINKDKGSYQKTGLLVLSRLIINFPDMFQIFKST